MTSRAILPYWRRFPREDRNMELWTATYMSAGGVGPSVLSPVFTENVVRLTETAVSGYHRISYDVSPSSRMLDNRNYTLSVFAKYGSRQWFMLSFVAKDNSTLRVWFNLSAGSIGTITSGATAGMVAYPNGWYLCSVTAPSGTGAVTPSARISHASADGSNAAFLGATNKYTYVWGVSWGITPHVANLAYKTWKSTTLL